MPGSVGKPLSEGSSAHLLPEGLTEGFAGGCEAVQMLGGNYIVYADDLAGLKIYRKPGRPKTVV